MNRFGLNFPADVRMQKQGAEFRTEDQLTINLRVKQWLLADPIAREKQFLRALVPNRKRKHAAQVIRTIGAILIVGVNDRFGVAVGVERVAEFLQFLAQFAVVVDLAVENDPGGAILVVNGLLPALQIDDREASHAQPDGIVEVEAVVVWSPMTNGGAHPRHEGLVNSQTIVSNYANNSTHKKKPVLMPSAFAVPCESFANFAVRNLTAKNATYSQRAAKKGSTLIQPA